MLAGSVALFQWFLTKFFETVSSTDSLGLSFDRLLVLFLSAYVTLPLLLIGHLAASDTRMRWPRIVSYVGVLVLLVVLFERARSPLGLIVLAVGIVLIARAQFNSLEEARARKSTDASASRLSRAVRVMFANGITRTGLSVLFATIALISLGVLSAKMPPSAARTFFRPCQASDSATHLAPRPTSDDAADERSTTSALCLYAQLRDSLARLDVAPSPQRAVALLVRSERLFQQARALQWRSDLDSASRALMLARQPLLQRRDTLAQRCDSVRFLARMRTTDFALVRERVSHRVASVKASTRLGTPKRTASRADSLADSLRAIADSVRVFSDSLTSGCALAMAVADSASRDESAWSQRREQLYGHWLRAQWATQINGARQVMLGAYLAALLLVGVWIATTPAYQRTKVQRQLSTLFATLIFFVPLLPGVRAVDLPLLEPSRLFEFPQWQVAATAVAPAPGRPKEATTTTSLVADSTIHRALLRQDSALAELRTMVAKDTGSLRDPALTESLKDQKDRIESLQRTLQAADSLSKVMLNRLK